jgi:hypothetical protein
MARWREIEELATVADLPEELWPADDEPPERRARRHDWLERHDLGLVDFLAWWRARAPATSKRPPARRRWLSPRERVELDEQREREGMSRW